MPQPAWNPDDYSAHARFVSDLGQPVLELLNPRPGERILDLGCGDGALTERLRDSGAAVTGADLSPDFIAAAQSRGLHASVMDAHHLPFLREFDAVFSNAALHWMRPIDPVLEGVRRALVPGGRFVAEFGGHGCVAAIATALRAVSLRRRIDPVLPWYFPTAAEFGEKLERHGFKLEFIALIPRPTPLPSGISAWLNTFAGPILEQLPESERTPAQSEAVELLRPFLCDESGNWTADYMRLRFAARLPGA